MTASRAIRACVWLALALVVGVLVDGSVCLGCPSDGLPFELDQAAEDGQESDCSLCLCRVVEDSSASYSAGLLSTIPPAACCPCYRLLLPSSLEHPPQHTLFLTAA
ncbi:MAG TPA: hypothetical protein VLU25_01450 [Acidobacteriota bacterium]|nr:hypothetical protein [Acidobacteriota bacterium]